MRILIAFLILLSACGSSVTHTDYPSDSISATRHEKLIKDSSTENSQSTIEQSQLTGAWTGGSTENATFDISKDSIFYLDAMTAFPYKLIGDSLIIRYPDFTVRASVQFLGDTLILSDPEFGTTKYTRFQD